VSRQVGAVPMPVGRSGLIQIEKILAAAGDAVQGEALERGSHVMARYGLVDDFAGNDFLLFDRTITRALGDAFELLDHIHTFNHFTENRVVHV